MLFNSVIFIVVFLPAAVLEQIALPLGISFFTFQQLSFIIERYCDRAPHYPVLDYTFFVCFFPQLIAGPIVLHSELIPQLQERKNRRFSSESFYDGLTLFILGLAKKVLLADSLAVLVNAEYNNIAFLDTPSAWIVICWYMAELYFDFSGYCDMARGIAAMLGFGFPKISILLSAPHLSRSSGELWWDCAYVNGELEQRFAVLEETISVLLTFENVEVYFFQNQDEIVCDLGNYMDMIHYTPDVNQYMLESMAAGENRLTRDNKEEFMQALRDMVEHITENVIFEYYPSAAPVTVLFP